VSPSEHLPALCQGPEPVGGGKCWRWDLHLRLRRKTRSLVEMVSGLCPSEPEREVAVSCGYQLWVCFRG
jgi:hypothetical protein